MEINAFTKAALTAVLVNNDFHYMHLLAIGEDFDKSHNLCEEYYTKIEDEVDYLMELSLEVHAPIVNYTLAGQVLSGYPVESQSEYYYTDIIEHLQNKVSIYLLALKELRNATADESIQSKIDDMIRDWEKELNYRLSRRAGEQHHLTNFII